jgi:TATA-box binding protein (TBP) (component of TFIID and TFIIIB)
MSLDEEWAQFIASQNQSQNFCVESSDSESLSCSDSNSDVDNFDEESEYFLLAKSMSVANDEIAEDQIEIEQPRCSDMYISTKSKIVFLNQTVDLKKVFWGIPVIEYATPSLGVVKKQMKFNSLSLEEYEVVQAEVAKCDYVDQHIIRSVNNPEGRVKFKDIRKVSVGLSKKDLLSHRCKKKSAFYNCFVLIIRMFSLNQNEFKEHHVKIFNTGKVGVVGVQSMQDFYEVLDFVVTTLQPLFELPLVYRRETCETILINSNFNTNFLINREAFYDLLKDKYNVDAIYDPCSYPGIQCKYSFGSNNCLLTTLIKEAETQQKKDKIKVSFMIFRTGSILVVGKCDEVVLTIVYQFLKDIIEKHFKQICQLSRGKFTDESLTLRAPKKVKKKNSVITSDI